MIAGIGNIYADEILHRADPLRPAQSLTDFEIERLCHAITEVLEEGLPTGGPPSVTIATA